MRSHYTLHAKNIKKLGVHRSGINVLYLLVNYADDHEVFAVIYKRDGYNKTVSKTALSRRRTNHEIINFIGG
jgi:hypothetical protein